MPSDDHGWGDRDPGDAVPPGVAPQMPPYPTEEDRKARRKLEREAEARELSEKKQQGRRE